MFTRFCVILPLRDAMGVNQPHNILSESGSESCWRYDSGSRAKGSA